MNRKTASTINDEELDALYERAERAESALLHAAAEAHRRKWAHDKGLRDDGSPVPSPAFEELHRIGEELRRALDTARAARAVVPAQRPGAATGSDAAAPSHRTGDASSRSTVGP